MINIQQLNFRIKGSGKIKNKFQYMAIFAPSYGLTGNQGATNFPISVEGFYGHLPHMCGSREEDILKFHTISQDDFIGVTNFTMLIQGFINIETMKLVFLKYDGSRKKKLP